MSIMKSQSHRKLDCLYKNFVQEGSTLLAPCDGNPPVTMDSLYKGPVVRKAILCHDFIMLSR